ncbi:5'-methylthioadenosine/adenosylhomocysteine nucleosidase [Longirhabdus pacifica]|uniref:5'-methylthioadenosine/adenosylhomocysteine nucleosidase n=1 Tax=Longirhabdus pacifica TaxID=2305227 RepID=UPI0023EA60F1|nr:5'-methylthioadenosine/adenosylhomocysteine nucleosidase [Longirhabdus pacifica]
MKTSWDKIAIIGAMDEEIHYFQEEMNVVENIQIAGIHYISGTWLGQDIVLCKCGVGKVNAAVCTQVLIDKFAVEAIIFTGVAGALNPALDIGDIVISVDCLQHDMDASPLGFERGVIPFHERSTFTADRFLVDKAYEASKAAFSGKVIKGTILSGDQFIADRTKVQWLHEHLHGDCTEMEGAAVAQVCDMNDIPFVIIRSMSDRADGAADVNFTEFTKLAAEHSFQIVRLLLSSQS